MHFNFIPNEQVSSKDKFPKKIWGRNLERLQIMFFLQLHVVKYYCATRTYDATYEYDAS